MNRVADIHHQVKVMVKCIAEVRRWMLDNKLKINDSKMECMMIGSKRSISKLTDLKITIQVGRETISPAKSVKNLGAILDCDHTMNSQISSVIRNSISVG